MSEERIRRDPRAEREARRTRTVEADEAPAPVGAAESPSGRVRRDPRAERAARMGRVAQPVAALPAAAPESESGRVRRDPRAERASRADRAAPAVPQPAPPAPEPSGRVRRDPRADRTAQRQAGPARAETAVPVKTVADPKFLILAVPDLEDARLSSHDKDVIGAARGLADAGGGAVVVLAFTGPEGSKDGLGEAGADRVLRFADASFAGYAPERRAAAVLAAIEALEPRHVLFPETGVVGGDVGRRVAVSLGDRAAGNVQRVTSDRIVRRGKGGRADFSLVPPRVLLVAAEAADPVIDERYEARELPAPRIEVLPRVEDRGLAATDPATVPMAEADFIVSAGNGVRDWDAFHRVAAALGASEGGSRPVCDAGHLPRHRQVGASGTLVEPRCYVALGIAGAPQHLQGISKVERVVAINADAHCDMVKRADLAVVGDVQALMPALERIAKERRHGH
ncbi:MAG: electron transfer flavoprotein subunit alpha/FixB family protein [Alphaproteobacteria bacterium]